MRGFSRPPAGSSTEKPVSTATSPQWKTYVAVLLIILGGVIAASLALAIVAITRIYTLENRMDNIAVSPSPPALAPAPVSIPSPPTAPPTLVQWLVPGSGDPAPLLGLPGQFYIDNSTGAIFYFYGGVNGLEARRQRAVTEEQGRYLKNLGGQSTNQGLAAVHSDSDKTHAQSTSAWVRINDGSSLAGDLAGTTRNVTVLRVGGISATEIAFAIDLFTTLLQNGTFNSIVGNTSSTPLLPGTNITLGDLSVNTLLFPALANVSDVVRITRLPDGTLQLDGGSPGSNITLNVQGTLLSNGRSFGNVSSVPLNAVPIVEGTIAVYSDASGTLIKGSAFIRVESNGTLIAPYVVTEQLNATGRVSTTVIDANFINVNGTSIASTIQQIVSTTVQNLSLVLGGDVTGPITNTTVQRLGGVSVEDILSNLQFVTAAVTNGSLNASIPLPALLARSAKYDNVTFPFGNMAGDSIVRLDGARQPGTLHVDGGAIDAPANIDIAGLLRVNNLSAVVSDPVSPFGPGYLALFRDENGTALISRAMIRVQPDGTFVTPFIVSTSVSVAGALNAGQISTNSLIFSGFPIPVFIQTLIDASLANFTASNPPTSVDFSVLNNTYVRRTLNLTGNKTLSVAFFTDAQASVASASDIRISEDLRDLLGLNALYADSGVFVGGVARGDLFWDNSTAAVPGDLVMVSPSDPMGRTVTGSGLAYNQTTQTLTGIREFVYNGSVSVNGEQIGNVRSTDNVTAAGQIAVAVDTSGKVVAFSNARISDTGILSNVTLVLTDALQFTGANRTVNEILLELETRAGFASVVVGFNATRNRALAYWSTENPSLLPGQHELRQTTDITVTADERLTGVQSIDVVEFVLVDGLRVNVSGPSSSVPRGLAFFSDASGRVLASSTNVKVNDSGLFISDAPVGDVRGPLNAPPIPVGTIALFDATGKQLLTSSLRYVNGTLIGVDSANFAALSVNGTDIIAYINALALQATAIASNFTGITASGPVQDNRLMRWDGATGLLAQSSGVVLSDIGDMSGIRVLSADTVSADSVSASSSTAAPIVILDSTLRIRKVGPGDDRFVFEALPGVRTGIVAGNVDGLAITGSSVSASTVFASAFVLTSAVNSLGNLSLNPLGDIQCNNKTIFNVFSMAASEIVTALMRNPTGSIRIVPAAGSFASFDNSDVQDVRELRFSTSTTTVAAPKLRLSGTSEFGFTVLPGNIMAYTTPVASSHQWFIGGLQFASLSATGLRLFENNPAAGSVLTIGARTNSPVLTGTPSGIDLGTTAALSGTGGVLAEQKLLIYSRSNGDFGGFTFNNDGHFISAMAGPFLFQWRWLYNSVSRMVLTSAGALDVGASVNAPIVSTNTLTASTGTTISINQNILDNVRGINVRSPSSPSSNFASINVRDDEGPSLISIDAIGTFSSENPAFEFTDNSASAISFGGRRILGGWQDIGSGGFYQFFSAKQNDFLSLQYVPSSGPARLLMRAFGLGQSIEFPRGIITRQGSAGDGGSISIGTQSSAGISGADVADVIIAVGFDKAIRLAVSGGVVAAGSEQLTITSLGARSPRFDDVDTRFFEFPIPGVIAGGVFVTYHRTGRMITMQMVGSLACVSGGGCTADYFLDSLCGPFHPRFFSTEFMASRDDRIWRIRVTQADTPGFCRLAMQRLVGGAFYATDQVMGPFKSNDFSHTFYIT